MDASQELPRTVPEVLAWRAVRTPSQVALHVDDGPRLTYEEWHREAGHVSAALADRGLGRQPVGILFSSDRATDYAIAWLAVQRAGGVPIVLPGAATDSEAEALVTMTAAREILTSAGRCTGSFGARRLELSQLAGDGRPEPTSSWPKSSDVAQVIFTSGTTGTPKGIAATHANLVAPALPQLRAASAPGHVGCGLFALPLGTNVAQTLLMLSLTERTTWVVLPRFTAEGFAAAVQRHRVTEATLVPAMALALLDLDPDPAALSTLREIGLTGAPMPAPALSKLAQLAPQAAINNYYSSTEAAPAMIGGKYDPRRPGAIGRTDRARCRIVPVEGTPAHDRFPIGEVWLRDPDVPGRAYYGDPPRSEGAFDVDGWTRTGDLGYLDDEGFLFLVDRRADVINSGGMKVATLEVEEALHALPAIVQAAVVGLEHPVLGQSIAAAVVSRAPTSEKEIRAALKTRLADHKIPHKIAIVDRLPQTPSAKVDKRTVAEELLTVPVRRVEPRSDTEKHLHDLWFELLHRDDFGIFDRFLDVGGHSLLAVTLAARIETDLGVHVPVSRLFFAGTIAELAQVVDGLVRDAADCAPGRAAM